MELSDEVRALIESLLAKISLLEQEVADLRRQLGRDSSNSSKPPSSDGLSKKPPRTSSLRGTSGKASGGQAGHKGGTLRCSTQPDVIIAHMASHCGHCRAALSAAMVTGVVARQVFEVPAPRLEVTEHRAEVYCCAACRGVTKAAFPAGVVSPVQYGPGVRAWAVYLNVQHLIPEDRVAEILADLAGARGLCPASITSWVTQKAAEWAPVAAHIEALLAAAPVRHLDETGFRIAGKTQWLHSLSTTALTHYRVSAKRGAVPAGLTGGIVVHDHFKPYFKLAGLTHALCNAHHLRELKALAEIDGEAWAAGMSQFLCDTNTEVERASKPGVAGLPADALDKITATYDKIVADGLAFHDRQPALARKPGARRGKPPRRPGHNLLIRLRDFKADVLRFAVNFAVPFTNNQAERDIRMMKLKMKISGCFRTEAAANTFATLRSILSTLKKQAKNHLEALVLPANLIIKALNA